MEYMFMVVWIQFFTFLQILSKIGKKFIRLKIYTAKKFYPVIFYSYYNV
jgi:hypothetical protein